jgi:hypothetical protein
MNPVMGKSIECRFLRWFPKDLLDASANSTSQ